MHRTDADGNVANLFDEGDPGVPRQPTQIDSDWLNAVQENICQAIEYASITLVKGTHTQLRSAITTLATAATTALKAAANTWSLLQTLSDGLVVSAPATSNRSGVVSTGNGSGKGVSGTGGSSSGTGGAFVGGASNGKGLTAKGTGTNAVGADIQGDGDGTALTIDQSGETGYGIAITANSSRGHLYLTPQASAPTASTDKGAIYMNTDGKLYVCNGSAWVVVGSQS